MRPQHPRPIPRRFLKPRAIDGSYPFSCHRTAAELLLAESRDGR